MNTIRRLQRLSHSPALLGLFAGVLVAAFAAGAITAQTLSSAKRPSIELVSATTGDKAASAIDSHAIGRDVYSIRGTPLGRLTAIIRGTDTGSSFALISTYDRDASLAGEIAIPVAQLDLQGDRIVLDAHLRTSVRRGLEIMEKLRGHTTGYAVPQFVIDAPGGGGKVPISPGYVLSHNNDRVVIRNFEGKVFEYPEAVDGTPLAKAPRTLEEPELV